MDLINTEEKVRRNFKHNYIVNVIDGSFFGCALGFASFSTVLPLFVSTLTNSAILIGLIPAFHNIGFLLPQLFLAKKVGKMATYKPSVMAYTVHERLPILILALIALIIPLIGPQKGLVLTFLLLAWQGLGAGFTANSWQNMINKVIPNEYLATFFGIQASAANLLSSGGAIAAGFILENFTQPYNYSICFLIASFCFAASWISLNTTREAPHAIRTTGFIALPFWESITTILKKDPAFRWYLIVRNLAQFGTMAFAFYTVYAVRQHGMSEFTVGVMTSVLLITQTIANPLLGWLADRWNRRYILEAGAIAAGISSLLAWRATDASPFLVIFILTGIANTVSWGIGIAFTLSFGSDEERPTYVGLANTLVAPSAILAPLIGGFLADRAGYPVTFVAATVASLATAIILHFFVHDPRKGK
ncbi:MAG TPA: MFS transporter [Anaerolineaceae bacterium]|nr:MFS transporter [Anaerolineaceae bacterium]